MKPSNIDADDKVLNRHGVHSQMLKKEHNDGMQDVIDAIDAWFKHRGIMENWEWEGIKLKLEKSKKRLNIDIDDSKDR